MDTEPRSEDGWVHAARNDMLDGGPGWDIIEAFWESRGDREAVGMWRRVYARYGQWFYCPHWEAAVVRSDGV